MPRLDDLIFWLMCSVVLVAGFMWGLFAVTTPEVGAHIENRAAFVERLSDQSSRDGRSPLVLQRLKAGSLRS